MKWETFRWVAFVGLLIYVVTYSIYVGKSFTPGIQMSRKVRTKARGITGKTRRK